MAENDPLENPAIAALPPEALTEVLRLVNRCALDRDVADQARARAEQERTRFARALVQRDRCRPGMTLPSALVGMIHRAEKLLGVDPGRRTRTGWTAPPPAPVETGPPASSPPLHADTTP